MNIQHLKNGRIVITGMSGFLGQYLYKELLNQGFERENICQADRDVLDLRDYKQVDKLFSRFNPHYVFHLAGYNGGISLNVEEPAYIFYNNTMMALNVLDACKLYGTTKILSTVASCAYPSTRDCGSQIIDREILKESEFLDGEPNETVIGHAYAKRNLQIMSKIYNKQYGLNAICVCPTTLYGPGAPISEKRTKVLDALIRKFVKAKVKNEPEVICWGTGSPMREFMYVEDAAKLLIESFITYNNSSSPLNLGTGQEFTIKKLTEKIAEIVDYKGKIVWDTSKPDGQYRKRLDLEKMNKYIKNFIPTSLDEGIRKTVNYHMETL